jgi:Na+/H+ antiporter NhaD/arsenite permease-like protein
VRRRQTLWLITIALLGAGLYLVLSPTPTQAQESTMAPLVTGLVYDQQSQPVSGATVTLVGTSDANTPLAEATTQPNGRYTLILSKPIPNSLVLHVERAHFMENSVQLSTTDISNLRNDEAVVLSQITLSRHVDASFWVATFTFVAVLALIATGLLHNTLSSLFGAAFLFVISYLGGALTPNLFIFNFSEAVTYVDWNVIFLIMGMMIVIAVVERTGIFQWMALRAYRVSGGRTWLMVPILMIITSVASAFLDNVTTMLLMTPITIQISLAMGISPLAFLLPEVMASNVAGISTLIGTPTNILIGSFANISFNAFLINQTPGVLMALLGLLIYHELLYRRQLKKSTEQETSPELIAKLEERAQIQEPDHLKKASVVGLGMLLLFIFGERFHLVPAVTALIGATALLIWIRPDIEEMIESVDWTTLVFFITLFIVVGAIQEVGLISYIANGIGRLVGQNVLLAMLAVTWASAILSMIIANIPFTAAMLPVVAYLSATIPGAHSKVLFFCLSIGSAMGGNGSLIGASANMVTAGIAQRAGVPLTYSYFFKKGFPALLITVGLGMLWLILRFLVLHASA